jgi:2-polyprenyl-3-methyl-5-hydroxy-6-metoxy-1,4-benzoquinol methylase
MSAPATAPGTYPHRSVTILPDNPGTKEEERSMSEAVVDESHPAYLKFLECFIAGASLQDIYGESKDGFGVRERRDLDDPETRRKLQASCRVQFARIFSHEKNLAEPIDHMVGLAGKKVLDFGSGTGALAVAVALRGARVTATDPTPTSLDACRWRAQYFGLDDERVRPVVVGTSPGLPFPDGSFDMVTCNSVFEFIPARREEHVRELVRMLRPGGHLVISTENGLYPFDYYTRQVFPLWRRAEMQRRNVPYGMTYFELRRWLRACGRPVVDLSLREHFNSLDHFIARRRQAGGGVVPAVAQVANAVLKRACRLVGVPSQVCFPYTTFVFELG